MTTLNTKTIAKVALLARIAMSDDELQRCAAKLDGVIHLFDQLDAVDTSGVLPMAHSASHAQRMREDIVTEKNQRELLQQHAPKVMAGLYLVPKVIEQV